MDEFKQLDLRSLPGPETIRRQVLPNGIVFLGRENFSSPSVVISGYLWAGALQEKPERAGLAAMTAASLMRGTQEQTFEQIYESIESIGARLSFSAGKHSTSFSGKALAEDLGMLLDLLLEVLRQPSFPKRQVDRLRAEMLTSLAIRDQETGARADLAFNGLIYPGHPYSVPTDGYKETVTNLTAADLRAFHRAHYRPGGMVICVVGGVKAEAAAASVVERFEGWKGNGRAVQLELPGIDKLKGLHRDHVTLEGKSQTDVVMGVPGPPRSDPDFLAAALANNILGRFGMYGRIGDVVREEAGLAYYAYSSLIGGHGPGPWEIVAGVNPKNLDRAIELIRKEMRKMSSRSPSQGELEDNQANFIGRLPLQLETNEGVAGAIVNAERHALGLDYYQRYPGLVASFAAKDILRVSRRFLDPDNMAIASAGSNGRPG